MPALVLCLLALHTPPLSRPPLVVSEDARPATHTLVLGYGVDGVGSLAVTAGVALAMRPSLCASCGSEGAAAVALLVVTGVLVKLIALPLVVSGLLQSVRHQAALDLAAGRF